MTGTTNTELLACPMCAGEADLVSGVGEHWVRCMCCETAGPSSGNRERAVTAWNTRATPDGLSATLLEALERQCDNIAFLLNRQGIADGWYEKFCREVEEDRQALAEARSAQASEGAGFTVDEASRLQRLYLLAADLEHYDLFRGTRSKEAADDLRAVLDATQPGMSAANAPTPAPVVDGEAREKIARVIDPLAWREHDAELQELADLYGAEEARRLVRKPSSLTKADAILALRSVNTLSGEGK